MAGNMLMINVGVNSKDAENSLASLEETLKNISKKDADLKVGENLAAEVENARKKYLDMVKMVNSTEGELQKAFAISGLKQTIADVNALNKKIAETGAKIKPIELQSVMFDGKELFDIKGIDKSLDKFAKKLDKDSNDAFANILTTNLGQKFFSKQKNELEKQLETDLKDLAKDFSQDKLEQYINKYLKIRSIDVAKSGKDKIATSGVTPKAITDLIDNKAISKQLAEGKIDVKAMFQKKATDVGFVKNMKDQIFSELMVFLNQNTDANTFGTKYTDAQMTEMTQGAKESKKQIKLLKEEFIGLINQYNGFNRNSKIELVLDTVARIESLRKELKGLGQDISEINNIEKQDEYKENLNTLKYTLIPDGNDDYYDEDFDTYLLKLKNDFNKLNNTNIQSIMSMNIGDEKKIEKLKENLTQIDELLIKTNSYDSIVPNVSSEVIGDIEILKKQREQIIAGLKKLNVDVAGVGIPMADYIAGGNKGSGGNSSGTGSGDGDGNGSGSGTGNGGVMTPEEIEKLKKDYADITAEVEKYKAQIAETTAKLEEMKKTQAESEGDKSKIKELQANLDALNVSYAEAQNKMKEYRSELAAYESMSLVQDANGNNVNQEQYDKLISDAKQTATELENTRNQLKMLQEQAAAGGSDEYVVQLNNQLKSTEVMLNKVTNELEYMESSRNRWMDRAEMNAVIDESGQSVYQNDYDNIVAKLSEMKTEAQNAKDELEKLKATSVQLGEGEQVAKTSDIEAVKGLSEAVKSLQDRMTKAEEILQEVPQGMDGLKKLSSQIQKMSGNFNEDGSIKSMGISAEALSEQLKNLDAEFDARIAKKIEEIEKKSYKENQPKKKFRLAESVKSLKVVAAQTAPKVEAQQVNNDIKSAQQDATVKAEEITKELYKETEQYKTLSKAVQEYNALTSQKLDATAYDARIERMQKMQALVASIIETVEKYEGKASELSELTLKSKNGNIGIQDTVKLDELMSKLKAGEAKNVSKKKQTEQLKQDAQKYVDVVRDYNNKFQSIISQKVSSGKQFNSMKQQLNDLSNSIDTIMDKYDQFKGQDFYSAEFASYGEKLRGTVKDSSLDLNEITKFKGYEQEVLSIQLKYSESLQKQKKEQDAVAEAARKKAEAEEEAVKAAEEAENKMSVAEKSREEQKRKVLERQAAQSGTRTSNINSAPPDNTTLGAILTEVKSINGKMDKPVETNVDNNTGILSDDERYQLEAYKKMSKAEQAYDLEVGYRDVGLTQLIKAKISAFSGSFEQLIEELQDTLVNRIGAITEDIQDPNFKYEEFDGRAIENVQQLAEFIQFLNSSKTTDTQDTTFDSTAIDNILAEVKAISQKMGVSNTKTSNNVEPINEKAKKINSIPNSVSHNKDDDELILYYESQRIKEIYGDINKYSDDIVNKIQEPLKSIRGYYEEIEQITQAFKEGKLTSEEFDSRVSILREKAIGEAGGIEELQAFMNSEIKKKNADFTIWTDIQKATQHVVEFANKGKEELANINKALETTDRNFLNIAYHAGDLSNIEQTLPSYFLSGQTPGFADPGSGNARFSGLYTTDNLDGFWGNEWEGAPISEIDLSYYKMFIVKTREQAQAIAEYFERLNKFIFGIKDDFDITEYFIENEGSKETLALKDIQGETKSTIESLYSEFINIFGDVNYSFNDFQKFISDKRKQIEGIEWEANKLPDLDMGISKSIGDAKIKNLSPDLEYAHNFKTQLLQALGYEGVDYRRTQFNTTYSGGTVVFDIKPESIKSVNNKWSDIMRENNYPVTEDHLEYEKQRRQLAFDTAKFYSQAVEQGVELDQINQNIPTNQQVNSINASIDISDEHIQVIRQKLIAALSGEQAVPISFVPNVESLKQQIADALKNVPVEITNNNINKVIKVNKFKANSDGVEALRNSISSQLKNVKIQSFDATTAAESVKETLSKVLDSVGLKFDTEKLGNEVREAVNAARDTAESAGRGNPSITASEKKNAKGGNVDPKKLDRLYASFERDVTSYYNRNTLILRDQEVNDLFSKILNDVKKQPKSKENLDVLYRRFSEAQIAAINKGLDFNADKSDIGTAVINKGYETLISQINKYLETNTKIIGSQFEEEFSKLLSEASKPAQARTDVDLKQLGAEFARLKNYVDEAGLSGNADNEAKKVSKLDRGYATLALDMKKFHEENNKLDKSTEWADKFNKLFNNITGSISRSEVELEDFRAQFANFKNEIPRDLLGSTVTSEFFENLKGYDIDSIAKIFEKQSGQVKSRLLNDKYGFESPKMTRDISQMLDAQADRLSGLINQENVSDNDIDGIVQHNKQMNNLIDTYQTYSEKRRELQELVSKDSSNEEMKRLLQESDALSNSQVYDVQAMKSWSDSYVEAVNNLKAAQSNSEKEQRSSSATSTQQNQYRALTKDIEEATATAQRFKEQYAGLLSDGLNAELNQSISDMSARSGISVDLSNSSEITTWNDESKKLLDTWTAIQERIKSSVVASGQAGEAITATMDYSQYTRKATNALSNLNSKYKDKLTDKRSAEFEQRLEAIRNKVKEISDDTSKYTANNVQVIETDIQQLEKLAKDFEVVQNSENKINSLIRTLSNSRNSIERRGSTAQPVVNSIDSEKAALEELKRQGQNLDIGNPESVRAFVEKLNEADTTVNKLKNNAEQIRISTNATASVAKLDSKFNDLLFKVDKFRRDNSKITSDKGISAQFDSLMRSIQTIEKSDVNFQRLRAQFDQLKATVQGKGLTGRSLGDELKYIAEKIGIKAMLGNSIYRVIGAFRQMVGIVTELDTGMTTLRRVTEETEATYRKFLKTAGDEAHELGSTVSGLVDSTGDFARLGYNIQEANALAKNAVMYSNVGWLDIQTATADMTSTMKAFNIEASDSIRIVDTFDILGKKLPLVTISVKGWRHSRPSKDIVNHNICVTTAGGVW